MGNLSMGSDRGRENWVDLLNGWGVATAQAERTFEEVVRAYSAPGHFYHTLDHVLDVVTTVEDLAAHCKDPSAVKLAAWLHDVIYDSRASDNEERSAEYAERLCERLSIPEGELVASLIRKTKMHDAEGDADAQVLLDADLAILGASTPEYRTYAEQIRREYAWVSEAEYRRGRRGVLERFLARPRIYHFLCRLEEPARRNMAAEIDQLAS